MSSRLSPRGGRRTYVQLTTYDVLTGTAKATATSRQDNKEISDKKQINKAARLAPGAPAGGRHYPQVQHRPDVAM